MTDGRRRSVLPVVVLDAVTGGDVNVDVEAAVDATTAPAAVPGVGTATVCFARFLQSTGLTRCSHQHGHSAQHNQTFLHLEFL